MTAALRASRGVVRNARALASHSTPFVPRLDPVGDFPRAQAGLRPVACEVSASRLARDRRRAVIVTLF
jgi:hypothetical protein